MAGLTTHVLDTMNGCPAAGVAIRLFALDAAGATAPPIVETVTNADGRTDAPLRAPGELSKGHYRLEFDVAAYFRAKSVILPDPPFLETVAVEFGIRDTGAHYHVPLLVSPYGYSTYRGS